MALLDRRLAAALIFIGCGGDIPGRAPHGIEAYAGDGEALVGLVATPLQLKSEGAMGRSFLWTLPDGTVLEGETANTSFDAPGHFTVFLEATGDEDVDVASISVTITWPEVPNAGSGSSPLAARQRVLYVAMPDHDQLARVDTQTQEVLWWPTCHQPGSVGVVGTTILVTCAGNDQVDLFDLEGPIGSVALPYGSRPMAVVPVGGRAVVALQGTGQLALLSPFDIEAIVDAVPDVRGLASTTDRVLASRHRSPDDGGQVWIASHALTDPEIWTLALDPGPDSDTNTRGVPSYLRRIAIRSDGRVAVVGGLKANTERGTFLEDRALTPDTTLRSDLRQLPLVAGEVEAAALFDDRDQVSAITYSHRGDWLFVAHLGMETIDVLDSYTLARAGAVQGVGHGPDGLWVSDQDRELWVLSSLSRELVAFDLTDGVGTPEEVARIDLQPPTGEPLDAEILLGKQIFHRSADVRMSEQGYLSCSSCHLDGDADGRTWDFTQRGEGLRNTIPLVGRAGTGHGPIHWSANFDEVQDFENDIRTGQGGHGFLSEADWKATSDTLGAPKAGLSVELDALAAYLESLDTFSRSPFRTQDGAQTPEAIAGQVLFEDPGVGCATCHPAPTYTDSQWLGPADPLLHDVGTWGPGSGQRLGGALVGLDTPTLRGGWETAPYLHDGSAPTLREVLTTRNAGDLHGTTSHLSEVELSAIEAFLLQLE